MVEVFLPFHLYIIIGLNAGIELENSINVALERIYNKYSHPVSTFDSGVAMKEISTNEVIWGIGRMGFVNIAKDAGCEMSDLKLEVIFNEKIRKMKKKYLDIESFVELMKEAKIIKNIDKFEDKFIKKKSDVIEEVDSDDSDLLEDSLIEDIELMDEVKNMEKLKTEGVKKNIANLLSKNIVKIKSKIWKIDKEGDK